jgi:hypothetical protein
MESMVNKSIDWHNSSKASIKMQLEALKHQQKTVIDKIITLSKNLKELEK